MSHSVLVLNGPNLNLLGTREPEIYGTATLADAEAACAALAPTLGLTCEFRQSNHEGQLVDWIQQAQGTADAIIINPAAYSHTSVALLDALKMYSGPVIEVHISNIFKRESFRHHSYVTLAADGCIAGCGLHGYELGLRQVASMLTA